MVQYDLFGEVEAAERIAEADLRARMVGASKFLSGTPWPRLLGWWVHPDAIEAELDHGEIKASYRRGPGRCPGWAWAVWRDGLRFEPGDTWQGWTHRPRWCIAWAELRRLRAEYPEVTARLAVLAAGRGHPTSAGWRWWVDPHDLTGSGWHRDCLDAEQQPGWYHGCERPETAFDDRIEAWGLVTRAAAAAVLTVTDRGATR